MSASTHALSNDDLGTTGYFLSTIPLLEVISELSAEQPKKVLGYPEISPSGWLQLTMLFNVKLAALLSLAVLGLASPVQIYRREFADVQEGLTRVTDSLNALKDSITAYPVQSTNPLDAIAVASSVSALVTDFTDAVTFLDATNPLDADQSAEVLASVHTIVPVVNESLSGLAQLKPSLDANPVEDVTVATQASLIEIKDSAVKFVDGLNSTTTIPETTIESIKADIFASFDSAIATFSA
ncbi:hypothetical protein CVT24_001080 [Panaeolus cyanescens]|uniref:Hydrophobic surface binding protein n=1 Tax=Panaeolus cyanescens TaxID=181874 RepID=A0A409VX25_9AGAR|nr:hypothetical protein CVT24_001080 [Panaeolus cyanescens]